MFSQRQALNTLRRILGSQPHIRRRLQLLSLALLTLPRLPLGVGGALLVTGVGGCLSLNKPR